VIVIWGGTKDVGKNETKIGLGCLQKFVKRNSHTNLISMDVPHRYDLDKTSCVNKEVEAYNRKLRKLMKGLDNTAVVNADLDRSVYTKHAQHMNAKAKEVMAMKIVTAIKNILKVHRMSLISMKWKDDQNKENQTTTTESQIEKSLVTNIIDIKKETADQIQQPKCQRRTPAHRQQDFYGCNDEIQGKG
jgi:hypothetical protein